MSTDPPVFGPEAYAHGDQFQREKRGLFATTWLPFCATAQVHEPGTYVNHGIGGWPIFALRGGDGVLRAFHNACRHQNMPVLDKPSGQCEQLRCRFHGWIYDLSGALVTAPPLVAPPDLTTQHLRTVSLAEPAGLVFVRVEPSGDAPPSIDTGAPFATALTTEVACNWKTLVELLLSDRRWQFTWPLALVRHVAGATLVRQIVPRSFARSRVVDLLFAEPGSAESVMPQITAAAGDDKARAEALQTQRAAGQIETDDAAVLEFRARVAAAAPGSAPRT